MAVTINGSTGVEYDDDVKLILGTGDDLELYHSSDQNYIYSTNGRINLRASEVRCEKADGSEVLAKFIADGACELRYDDSAKFKTASYGTLQNNGNYRLMDSDSSDPGWARIQWGQSQDLQIYHEGTNSIIETNSSATKPLHIKGDPIWFYKTGTSELFCKMVADSGVELYHDNVNTFQTAAHGATIHNVADPRLVIQGSGHPQLDLSTTGTTDNCSINFGDSDDGDAGEILYNHANNRMLFYVNGTEAARITSGGFLKGLGDYSGYISATDNSHELNGDSAGYITLKVRAGSSQGHGQVNYVNSDDTDEWSFGAYSLSASSYRLYIWSNGNVVNNNNSFGSLSDIKLKENIVDASSQWDDIKNIKVRKFNFKDNPSKPMIGLIAQEAETVSPGLVDSHKDLDSDNKDLGTTTKSIKYSVLYMKAIKALQEAMTKIETLETKVAALEAG
jgi:hypothetical protein